jgi:hypothetical protein
MSFAALHLCYNNGSRIALIPAAEVRDETQTRRNVNGLPDTTDANHGLLKVGFVVDTIGRVQHCLYIDLAGNTCRGREELT